MGKAGGGIRERVAVAARGRHETGIGRINRNLDLAAYAFDDAGVNLPIVDLRAAAVIGVDMNDGGAGARAGHAFATIASMVSGMPGCSVRPQGPFSAASIQTFRNGCLLRYL